MATLTTLSGVIGSTPQVLGYNLGHFMGGSNVAAWWRYSGVKAARAFISPSDIEPVDDIDGLGDGVSSSSGFASRRTALRANAASPSVALSNAYVNWNAFSERYQNALGDTNRFSIAHAFSALRSQNVAILANITASPSRFPLADSGDWGNAWELWQHYYAQAFLLGRDYGVERYGIFNEPNNWTWAPEIADPVANWLRRLQLASDAIQAALADLNSRYGSQLQAQIFAPNTANGATKYNTGSDTWGRRAVLSRHLRWDGSTDASWSNFQVYNYQKYSTSAADYSSDFQTLRGYLNADGETALPLALTEFNVRTGSNYDSRSETLDSPSDYSALAANCIALSQAGASQLYLFKFAQTARSGGTYPVAKNGTHYVQNSTSTLNNVGGATKAAEVYRLFVKASGSSRQLLATSSSTAGAVQSQLSRDPLSGDLAFYLVNTGSSAVDLDLDLTALGVADGSLAVVEEVSERFSGGVARLASVSGGRLAAGSLAPQAVWLVSLPGAHRLTTITASADTVLADGAGSSTAGGGATELLVRADGTVNGRRVSLLRFSLADLDAAHLEAVLLRLSVAGGTAGAPAQAHLYGLDNDSWNEASLSWSGLPDALRQGVAAGSRIEHNVVANQGSSTTLLGQIVVDSGLPVERQIDVSDFVRRQSDGWASFLIVQEHRWDVALPSLSSGDIQASGLRIVSREGAGPDRPQLQLLSRTPNSEPPRVIAATVSGNTVLLSFSEPVQGNAIVAANFSRTVGGSTSAASAVTPGSSSGSTSLTLSFGSTPASSASFQLGYSAGSGTAASGLVTDSAGNVLSLAQQPLFTFESASSVSSLSTSYTNLVLTGSASTATGNSLANRILGNASANLISGGGGADRLDGADGADVYLIADSAEHASGERISDSGDPGSGIDEIRFSSSTADQILSLEAGTSGIERVVIGTGSGSSATTTGTTRLSLNASAVGQALQLTGNSGANGLVGTAQADSLSGGNGIDTLSGGGGADRFLLSGISTAANRDRITDFAAGSGGDLLVLSDSLTSRSGTGAAQILALQRGSSINLYTGSSGFDLFALNSSNDESDVDLAAHSDGTGLLDGLNAAAGSASLTTSTKGGRGYLLAYDNGGAYLYAFNAGSNNALAASEIQLIASLEASGGLTPGSLTSSNATLA
ncbi:MAG: hypothetical protein VKM92_03160 [Cyanobacteriota bacterium]|nr:hypothetical protein [Cyanobacteriota bacterium]